MRERRGPWYLLTGLILGVVIGLAISWGVSPGEAANAFPDTLRADYKDAYRALIALAYDSSGDLTRAEARLALLNESDAAVILAAQSQRYLAEGYSYTEALALARLSSALGEAPAPAPRTSTPTQTPLGEISPEEIIPSETETASNEATPAEGVVESPSTEEPAITPTPTLSRTPIPTFTPLPTFTLTPTLSPPYVLGTQSLVCEPALGDALIQLVVTNVAGEGVPGVEVVVQWEGNEEHFYTGLKPEMGLGYADFEMAPEVNYTLYIADGGEVVPLFVPECSDAGDGRYWGGWRLVFTHP